MEDMRSAFQMEGRRTFDGIVDMEYGKGRGRVPLHSAGSHVHGINMVDGVYAGCYQGKSSDGKGFKGFLSGATSEATTRCGDTGVIKLGRSSIFDSREAYDSELLGDTAFQQGGAAPDVLATASAGCSLPPSVLDLLFVTGALWAVEDHVFCEPAAGAGAEFPNGAAESPAELESLAEPAPRGPEAPRGVRDVVPTAAPPPQAPRGVRDVVPTAAPPPQAVQQEECLTSDIDAYTECESDPDDPTSDWEGEPTTIVVGPTHFASHPYKLDQVLVPGPEGKVAIRSCERQLVLSDALRLQMAWNQVPLSFGSAVHLVHGASLGCRPCMYERWAGRCSKKWLCDFCHMHSNTKRRKRSSYADDGAMVTQLSTAYSNGGYGQPQRHVLPPGLFLGGMISV